MKKKKKKKILQMKVNVDWLPFELISELSNDIFNLIFFF